jgi:hypothetical protein
MGNRIMVRASIRAGRAAKGITPDRDHPCVDWSRERMTPHLDSPGHVWQPETDQPRIARLRRTSLAVSDPVRDTRWIFVALCAYLASQAYTVPIVPIGPWPLWPGLPDLMLGVLVAVWAFSKRSSSTLTGARRIAMQAMAGVVVVCGASYVLATMIFANLDSLSFGFNQQGPAFGLFEIVRLLQFLSLFWIALQIPLTPHRMEVSRRVVTGTFLLVSVSVLATFHNVLPPGVFAPLLPRDKETAGAWWHFVHNFDGYGLGAISYTHAYVAAQVTLLLGLTLHLRGNRGSTFSALLLVLALAATLVSGSRAGFAGVLLVAGLFLLSKSPKWLVHCVMCIAILAAGAVIYLSSQPPAVDGGGPLGSIVEHQINAFKPFETENLVGRDEIWSGRIDNMNEHPWRWFTGWGFGSSPDTGPGLSPHMLPLQIAMELGVGMLMLIAVLCWAMLRNVWFREERDHPFFWTTIALFLSSATQETFYPVPSTGYFLGFYLVALAIVLRPQTDPVVKPARRVSQVASSRKVHTGDTGEQLSPGITA